MQANLFMKRVVVFIVAFVYVSAAACSQNTITGAFPNLANQHVKLVDFDGFNTYTIDSVKASDKGYFQLSFSKQDYGMDYLEAEDSQPFIVMLAYGEHVSLAGEALSYSQTVVIKSGRQNQLFEQYASEHPRREQALSAWVFLDRIYQ